MKPFKPFDGHLFLQGRSSLISIGVLLVSLLLTFVGWREMVRMEEKEVRDRFHYQVENISQSLEVTLKDYESLLEVARGLFYASKSVERDEWKAFVDSLKLKESYPGAVGLGFIEWVPESQKGAFLKKRASDGQPGFRIYPEGKRDFYCPITFIEPEERSRAVIGYDLFSEKIRREALDESRKLRVVRITGLIHLVQDSVKKPSFLMVLPVHKNNDPNSLLGWIYTPVHVDEMFEPSLKPFSSQVSIRINENGATVPFYQNSADSPMDLEKRLEETIPLEFDGKKWNVTCVAQPAFMHLQESLPLKSHLLLGAGIAISFSLFGLAWAFLKAHQKTVEQVESLGDEVSLQKSVFHFCKDSIIITDPRKEDNPVVYVNPAFEKMTGYHAHEVIGKNCRFLSGTKTCQDEMERLREAIRRGGEYRGVIQNLRKDGTWFENELSISPIRDSQGKLVNFIGIANDVTARKQFEEEVKQSRRKLSVALEAALQAGKAKAQFMANVSHEIRTPLNGIVGMTEVLKDTPLTSEQVEYLSTIRESVEILMVVVNDILDFSKLESGKLSFENHKFNLEEVIQKVVDSRRVEIGRKGLTLKVEIDPTLPSSVHGDPLRLRQIMDNLISNAIKFTEKGGVVLRVSRQTRDGAFVCVKFEVEDTGAGISKETLVQLFEPFFQADSSYARKFGGTGLGLSICKQLIERMHGEIQVQSEPGKGSCFSFTARFELSDKLGGMTEATSDKVRGDGIKILLVEDNPINLRVATQQLKRLGYHADVATHGEEALEQIRRQEYDLILMDCQMSELDGYATTREIRKREGGGRHTPIIAMTAHALVDDRLKCEQAGMDDYLNKPFRSADLRKILEQWLPLGGQPQKDFSVEDVSPWDFDLATLQKITGDNRELLEKTLHEFLDQADHQIMLASHSLREGRHAEVGREVHHLAGAAGLCGAMALARICQQIEKALRERTPDIQRISELLQEAMLEVEGISGYLKHSSPSA